MLYLAEPRSHGITEKLFKKLRVFVSPWPVSLEDDFLGIDFLLGRSVVACAGHRARVDQRVEPIDRGAIQPDLRGTDVFLEMVQPRRPGNRDDAVALRQRPGQGELTHRAALLARQGVEPVEQREVAGEVLALEPRHVVADVFRRQRRGVAEAAGQKPAAERAERHQRDPELAAGVEHRDFRIARPQGVLALYRRDRMDGVGPADRPRGHFAQADGTDLPGGDEVGKRTDALLDRDPLVPPVQVVHVDDVGLQPLEALVAVLPNHLGTPVDRPLPLLVAEHAAFAGEHDLAPAVLERPPDQRFIGAEPVERRRIEVGEAQIERLPQDDGALFGRWRGPVRMRQAHAPEADGGDAEGTELASAHKLQSISTQLPTPNSQLPNGWWLVVGGSWFGE